MVDRTENPPNRVLWCAGLWVCITQNNQNYENITVSEIAWGRVGVKRTHKPKCGKSVVRSEWVGSKKCSFIRLNYYIEQRYSFMGECDSVLCSLYIYRSSMHSHFAMGLVVGKRKQIAISWHKRNCLLKRLAFSTALFFAQFPSSVLFFFTDDDYLRIRCKQVNMNK